MALTARENVGRYKVRPDIVPAHTRHIPIELVHTDGMPEKEWLKYRRLGIGGSEVATLMGLSPWATARDLYYDKAGIKPAVVEEENWAAKEIGHALEDLIVEMFRRSTGLHVEQIKIMYRHPVYPFMQADVDAFVVLDDGRRGILEIKTSSPNNRAKWQDGAVPYNYELQGRHYMAVMDVDFCFFCCLFLGDYEPVIRLIERDMDTEADIIAAEEHFWSENVLARVEPPYTEDGDLVLKSIRKHHGDAQPGQVPMLLPAAYTAAAQSILDLRKEKSKLDAQSRELDKTIRKHIGVLADVLGTNCNGVIVLRDKTYEISYNPSYRQTISAEELKRMEQNDPDVYGEYVTRTETRQMKVTLKGA